MPAPTPQRRVSTLLQGIDAQLQGLTPELGYTGLRDDSREIQPGDIYLAIPGARADGHSFVRSAAERGAVALIVETRALATHGADWSQLPLIIVPDTTALRPQLAGNHYAWPERELELVGVTGTNGKTTVTHLLAQIWRACETPCARLGTTDNLIGDKRFEARFTTPFPIELRRWLREARDAGVRPVAMEVSSHALAQGRVDGLRFRAAALTSFSQDHLDFHPTMRAYLEAKCILASRLDVTGLAVAVIGTDTDGRDTGAGLDAAGTFLSHANAVGCRTLSVSLQPHPDAEMWCASWSQDDQGLQGQVKSPWGEFSLRSPLVGAFNLENLLCASAMALDLGISTQALQAALPHCTGAPGRLERVHVPDPTAHPAVFVDYAHTPDAVERASATLQAQHAGQLITVLGCGGDRDRAKRPLMAQAALAHSDFVVFSSDNPRTEDPQAILDDMVRDLQPGAWTRIGDRKQAIFAAIQRAEPGDRVLIAGKGHETYQIIGETRHDFDDRIIAEQALLQRQP